MEFVVDVEGLVKYYGSVKAVDGVTLKVRPGCIFGLIGPNGAGKTTIIRSLTGQLKPTAGKVSVLGVDVLADPVGVRKVVGIIPEQEAPASFLTAEEYLSFVCSIRMVADVERRLDFWFNLLDFHGQRNMLCKDLSRGTRQKLMLVQAFIHEPKLVFIDEPLVNLDPLVQKSVKDFLRDYARKGNTIFMCSHLLEIVEEVCNDIAILGAGKIKAEGQLKELLRGGRHLEGLFLELVGGRHA
ncbi:MAG: ABC transporter ATP-binding protein [Candidatus Altiarchaeota archaeon]